MDARGLVRCWFDLSEHEPEARPSFILLDGGTAAYRLLGRGAGVTGYDEGDCLELLRSALSEDLPPVISTVRDVAPPQVDRAVSAHRRQQAKAMVSASRA
jgi:hypothetical protein